MSIKTEEINLDKINVDDDLFLRDEYDRDAIDRYAEKYEADGNNALPPLVIQKETLLLIDGFHRLMALKTIGSKKALVEVIETDDPRAEAIRRNAEHGVPLGKEERNKQIVKLVDDGYIHSEIAELFGLARNTVTEIANKSEERKDVENRHINVSQILKERIVGGLTQNEVAKDYDRSRPRISQIESNFKDEMAEKFLGGPGLGEIQSWIKKEHSFELNDKKLRNILSEHKEVPSCLVESANVELDGLVVRFEDCLGPLGDIEEESIDCIVTDPPYGIGFSSSRYRNEEFDVMEGDDDTTTAIKAMKKFGRVLKNNSHAYIFTRWDVYPLMAQNIPNELELSNLLVWNKGPGGHGMGDLNDFAPQYELIMLLEKGSRDINGKRKPNVLPYQDIRHTDEEKFNPTQKPIKLIKFLIEKSTDKGETVLDPFLGSGTTAVASYSLKRDFVGFEINKEENEDSIKKRILGVYSG